MKKVLAIIVSLAMCFSCLTVVSSATTNESETMCFVEGADGIWHKSASVSTYSAGTVEAIKDVEFENVYMTSSGDYLQAINNDDYIPVSKMVIPLSTLDETNSLSKYGIPDEMYYDIYNMGKHAAELGNMDIAVNFFVADVSIAAKAVNTNIMPMETTTYQGHTYHHRQIYFTNVGGDYTTIVEGTSVSEAVLDTVSELAIYSISSASSIIGTITGIIDQVKTLFDIWKSATGLQKITPNAENYMQMAISYNILLKYTWYVEPSDTSIELLGAVTQKVRITGEDFRVHYMNPSTGRGTTKDSHYTLDKLYYSENFQYPEDAAFTYKYSGVGLRESIEAHISIPRQRDVIVHFTYPNFSWPSNWPQ